MAVGNVGHILYEGWEYYADVIFGTDNVHGEADIINDLLVGAAASVIYVMAYRRAARRPTDSAGH